ncbi:hypothetical protein [Intestinimonas massiliensis (ex Afouda et al. 2020)]|jgi:hypothetical protein|uniref:Uncharacterized protein n=1 Tax=Intestinimonas massiliensis (ex Afouda et al. 2020) TaxID=1673721 RepID=A0ABS9M6N8_9FIRM|nr:hypothetical protein [Intestinimonas massiliensis (ex Afouda et al. 2020)]MCG4526462.1 hypothetical protein [Intestinimonas massiliensis (ex Afouda et al. 2020)]
MMGMCACEVIDLICSVSGVVATIIIGIWQCRQNAKINKLSHDQMETERQRHSEAVDAMVRKFLSEYHETIGLLPLCAIAASYNDAFPYSRKMYFDFILLPMDVRTAIFSRCGWKMCDIRDDKFFQSCIARLEMASKIFLSNSKFISIFYDSGKHIEHAISDHKNLKTPANFDAIGNLVSDIIQEAILSPESKPGDVYSRIIEETHFQTVPNDEAIMIACCTAISVAKHSGLSLPEDDSATDFGFPGAWSGESIETMEDLFLLTLFEIWQNLWDIEDRLLQKESEEFYDHQ